MMMLRAAFALLVSAGVAISPAHAEGSAKEILSFVDGKGPHQAEARAFLVGVSNGLGWASSHLDDEAGVKLFCEPEKLGLTPEQSIDIFRRFVESHPQIGDSPAGLVMLHAMIDTFPCPR